MRKKRWEHLRSIRMAGVVLAFLGAASGMCGLATLLGGLGGDDELPWVSLEQAPRRDGPARLSGRLESSSAATMPDDGAPVIRGHLIVSARRSGTSERRELERWSGAAPDAYLTDGAHRVPVRAVQDLEPIADRSARARVEREPGRMGRPIAVRYRDRRYPLADPPDRLVADVDRAIVPAGQPVVLSGRLRGGALEPGASGTIRVQRGTPEQVASRKSRTAVVLVCLAPALILLGLPLAVWATLRLWARR